MSSARKTVAVAMIVKNEEALLARCLESVKECDNLYILDTGSVDRTVEIARKYTDNVFLDFVWMDSFQKAHNHLLSKIRGKEDFILSIDADEVLTVPFEHLRHTVELAKDTVRVTMSAEGGGKVDFGFPRLFRNTPDIFWCQDIHKHLNVPGEGEPVGNVRIMYGHSPAHERDPDRALRVLEKTVSEEESPRNLYYLGREYWYKQRYQESIDTFQRYLKISNWGAEAADACLIMAQANAVLGNAEEAAASCMKAVLINSNFKEAIQFMSEICLPENKPQWDRMARTANNEGVLWKRTEVEPPSEIFISVHNDDESLFGAFTLLRKRPLVIVCTDSYLQHQRGEVDCDAETRRDETRRAMKIAGCPVVFLGIKDTELTAEVLIERLRHFKADKVYAPAIQGGNIQHDLVGAVAKEMFGELCEQYTTYTKTELYTTGRVEIIPSRTELATKDKMLGCYMSQINLPSTISHFYAVIGKSEWFL